MVSQYQRKTINAYISSHYQEMFHVWNVPLDQNHYSLDNLIVSKDDIRYIDAIMLYMHDYPAHQT